MGSPRVTSRPSAPRGGGGTGGGTTGGGTIAASGYDRYIGTVGETGDAPTGSGFPHYTNFPAAQKNEWVRIVSIFTLPDLTFLISGEEWICKENNTPAATTTKWERRQNNELPGYEVKRSLDYTFPLPPNTFALVKFKPPEVRGKAPVVSDLERTDLSLWFPNSTQNIHTKLDIDLVVNFGAEPAGDRFICIGTQEYSNPPTFGALNPDGTLVNRT
jgi:hypothetical protein